MRRGVLALCAAVLAVLPASSYARAPVTPRTSKDFRELIVRGERPEIAACMVAALNYVRDDSKYDALRWLDDLSYAAIMRESESGGHLVRTVRLPAEFRAREHGNFFETWRDVEIVCEQRDEESPQVRFTVIR
jgi:hypothetical protein